MSPGGIVGLVFFIVFIVMAGFVTVIFVMKRQNNAPSFMQGLLVNTTNSTNEDGIENPGYDTMHYDASQHSAVDIEADAGGSDA